MADVEKIKSMTHKERTELFLNYDRLFTKIENLYRSSKGEEHKAYSKVLDVIADMAVEIVRCKDCKHYRKHPNSSNGLCYAHTQPYDDEQILRGLQVVRIIMKPDGFCSYGERKEVQE